MISSFSSWILVWVGLEINSFSFISINKSNSFQLKYFLIQALGSLILVCGVNLSSYDLIFLSITLKIASAPFYFWIYSDLKFLRIYLTIIFFTFQKIGPLILIRNLVSNSSSELVLIFSILNFIFRVLGGLLSKSLQEIFIHSSINQLGWMFICLYSSKFLFYLYCLNYFISSFLILLWKQLRFKTEKAAEAIGFFRVFSGFPPSLLFLLKLYVFVELIKLKFAILVLIIIFILVIITYIYLKLFIKALNRYKIFTREYKVKSFFIVFLPLFFMNLILIL